MNKHPWLPNELTQEGVSKSRFFLEVPAGGFFRPEGGTTVYFKYGVGMFANAIQLNGSGYGANVGFEPGTKVIPLTPDWKELK